MLCLFRFVDKVFCSIAQEDEVNMSFIVAVVYGAGIGAVEGAMAAERVRSLDGLAFSLLFESLLNDGSPRN